uniref:Endonuclease domain-containing 1 protein-like n=1 Tax=Taeniopygia guttata TaxID=59729 RepID=A0A674GUN9_TAEGU
MLGLLLLQVLASCLWLKHSKVVTSFASPQFFYNNATPSNALLAQNPAWICQHYKNQYNFATLYDRKMHTPLYSACIYQPGPGSRSKSWFVEPQLIDKNSLKQMERESVLTEKYKFTLDQIKESQAVLADYKVMKGLDRGHLSPSSHQDSRESKTATFTLTNIVPQDSSLNTGQWNNYECKTMVQKTKDCKSTYVITGAVPGNTYVSGNRVNRPSHIWSAACCLGEDTQPKDAWGAIAENDKNMVELVSLGVLEKNLTDLYGKTVTLFNNACPRYQSFYLF